MKTALKPNRFDSVALSIGKNVVETPQGFLKIKGYTARTGIQKYRMDDGKILNEFRPESEVFSKSSMDSLETAVVTNSHPSVFVDPDNAKELMVGFPQGGVSRVDEKGESFLATDLIVTHREAIDAIKAGKAELSNGYHVDLEFAAGSHKGEKYDAIQRNIINNHIAIVWRARGGENVRLRLDSESAILINESENKDSLNEGEKTMKLKIGDNEFEVSDEAGKAIKSEMTTMSEKNDSLEAEKKGLTEKNDSLETENEVLKAGKSKLVAKCDSLQSDLEKKEKPEMPKEKFDAAVKTRIALVDSAKKMLSKDEIEKVDSMSDEEIKVAVIKADSPSVDEEKLKDAAYVNARFDHISENWNDAESKTSDLGKDIVKNRENNDGDEDETYVSPEQKRLDNMKKDAEASRK